MTEFSAFSVVARDIWVCVAFGFVAFSAYLRYSESSNKVFAASISASSAASSALVAPPSSAIRLTESNSCKVLPTK